MYLLPGTCTFWWFLSIVLRYGSTNRDSTKQIHLSKNCLKPLTTNLKFCIHYALVNRTVHINNYYSYIIKEQVNSIGAGFFQSVFERAHCFVVVGSIKSDSL